MPKSKKKMTDDERYAFCLELDDLMRKPLDLTGVAQDYIEALCRLIEQRNFRHPRTSRGRNKAKHKPRRS